MLPVVSFHHKRVILSFAVVASAVVFGVALKPFSFAVASVAVAAVVAELRISASSFVFPEFSSLEHPVPSSVPSVCVNAKGFVRSDPPLLGRFFWELFDGKNSEK